MTSRSDCFDLAPPDDEMPDPLVPPEVDLNGLGFMPMKHLKVLQSTLFVKSTGDEFKAAFALWCTSWTEVPAGSLPDDEQMLETFSRSKVWTKVRDRALHRWVKCSDGRLYHPVIAELALDAWVRRDEYREKQENKETRQDRWRKRVKELSEQLRQLGVVPPTNAKAKVLESLLEQSKASRGASTTASQASTSTSQRASHDTSHGDACETALTVGETGTETEGGTCSSVASTDATIVSMPPAAPPVDGDSVLTAKDLVVAGVEAKVARDWLKVRKAKKAPLTQTAWEGVKREAAAAGLTPAAAVKVAAENNWQGFKSSWYRNLSGGTADPGGSQKGGLGSRIRARLAGADGAPEQGVIDV